MYVYTFFKIITIHEIKRKTKTYIALKKMLKDGENQDDIKMMMSK